MRHVRVAVTIPIALAALACGSAVLAAQGPAGLEAVDALVRSGRTEEARVALLGWWEDGWEGAGREDAQRALWLRARLTVDPAEAELDYQRLAIEYPGGLYSDEALLRLAQAAHALGDSGAAAGYAAALTRDYPESAAGREARDWLARVGEPLASMRSTSVRGRPEAQQRSEIVSTTPPAPDRGPPPDPVSGAFGVQVGAFASAARAGSLRDRLTELGITARVVRLPRTQLLHVRVGRFDSEHEARELLAAVERLGFTGSVVRDVESEETVGG